jgi:hypothetical protein
MKKNEFMTFTESERLNRVLEGQAYYASVHTPNLSGVKLFNALPTFQVNLALDEHNQKLAASYGLKIRPADDNIPMPYVKIARKVKEGVQADAVKPQVVDAMQNAVPPNILVGNGSKVAVKFGTYWYEQQGGGVGTTLFKVQIKELVPYNATKGDKDLAMDSTGFTVGDFQNTPVTDDLVPDTLPWEEETPTKGAKAAKVNSPINFDE